MKHVYTTTDASENAMGHSVPRRQTLEFLRQFSRTILPALPVGCIVIN